MYIFSPMSLPPEFWKHVTDILIAIISGMIGGSLVVKINSNKVVQKQKSEGDNSPNTINV